MELKNIRNFWIIAHIDHWKSTLADRLLEITGTIEKRDLRAQTLDLMDLEQEKGITIKLSPVRMNWKWYELNMIDTPGHVDFQYEVSRSLASVEWAILIVDRTQWIEAQTLSNVYIALDHELDIIPVINKIDLPARDVDKVKNEIINLLWVDESEIIPVSAKTWENIEAILEAVIDKVSHPMIFESDLDTKDNEVKALVFDSQYDPYRWVVSYVKVFSGEIKKWDALYFIHSHKKVEALDVGYFAPRYVSDKKIWNGSIWYIVTWLKSVSEAKVWDTIWRSKNISWPSDKVEDATPIDGFKEVKPFIFAGVFPVDTSEYPQFKDSFEKLVLNDSSLTLESEVSPALWHGYRCWFLWLLHLDIVKERLWREFDIDVIITQPQVTYKVLISWDKTSEYNRFHPMLLTSWPKKMTQIDISNPEDLPPRELYDSIMEPIATCDIITPVEYIWVLMQLSQERRWVYKNQVYIDESRVTLTYEIPMNELIWDFYDEIKSLSSGYASINYDFLRYQVDDLVRLDVLIAWEKVDALSMICHRDSARYIGWKVVSKLKEVVPKAQFAIALQVAIWSQVIARETISAYKKDVTAKLYGWDVSRKKKLLEKQKRWKKKMKQIWKVSLPSEAFVGLLKK